MVVISRIKAHLLFDGCDENQSKKFHFTKFNVEGKYSSLSVTVTTHSPSFCQIPFSLISPDGVIRMMKTEEGGAGDYTSSCTIGDHISQRGGLSGPINEGEWKLILHKRRFSEDVDVDVLIQCGNEDKSETEQAEFFHGCKNCKAGWYNGELHVHSNHSTGRDPISEVIKTAEECGLDFLAITDHFTVSHWDEEAKYSSSSPLLLIQSMELSGDRGHANLHGIRSIKNPYVDDDGTLAKFLGFDHLPTMDEVASSVHKENGLFSINHIDSNIASAWRYHEFDKKNADILEVWCTSEGDFSLRYPAIWDSILLSGHHITGVASSDSHKAKGHPLWALGCVRTWIYADNLSERGILDGIKRGRVYMAKGKAKMDFYASLEERKAYMGESVCKKDIVGFNVELEEVPEGNLFVYISGELENVVHFKDGNHKWSFLIKELPDREENYIRLEYYDAPMPPRYWGDAPRSQDNLRLLSNPIFIRK